MNSVCELGRYLGLTSWRTKPSRDGALALSMALGVEVRLFLGTLLLRGILVSNALIESRR